MAAKKIPKVKKGQPPAIDKLLVPAIVVALAMVVFQFVRGLGGGIKRVNLADEAELREVFFGEGAAGGGGTGKSYIVLCHDEESTFPVSSVFSEAFNEGAIKKETAEFRLIDCNYILPSSEKTVADRFGLDVSKRPTIFVSGAVGAPQQVPEQALKTGAMLTKFLRGKLEARAAKIETTGDLKSKCLDKNFCGLLLKGAKKAPSHLKDAMGKLLKDFPDDVAFASIDSSVLYLLNLEDLLPELEPGQARFVMFKKISGSLEPGGSRLITSYAAIPTSSSVTYSYMNNLVSNIVSGTEQATKLSTLPVVKTRSKKLEESEKAKRQRRINQQQRKHEKETGESSGESSSSGENDGSKEGRRAERERRRQEHNAKNNVKPKTPEEIAEMERRRRARMEEEAAKWNVAPDDAPEEGEPIDGGDNILEDDYDDEVVVEDLDVEQDEEDDEDVIDLD